MVLILIHPRWYPQWECSNRGNYSLNKSAQTTTHNSCRQQIGWLCSSQKTVCSTSQLCVTWYVLYGRLPVPTSFCILQRWRLVGVLYLFTHTAICSFSFLPSLSLYLCVCVRVWLSIALLRCTPSGSIAQVTMSYSYLASITVKCSSVPQSL